MEPPRPTIIAIGKVRTVRFLVLPDGTVPVRAFLEDLQQNRKTEAKAMAVIRTAERLAHEHQLPRKVYRYFDDTFNEIVCTGCRVLTCPEHKDLLLVHGFLKNENEAPRKEVKAAYRILEKYRSQ
jgi:hypothetical protein